jgi:uridine kinase
MTTVHFTIGITGGSGSGKTRFITELASKFTAGELCVISQDHYYKPIEHQEADAKGIENFDLPSAIDHEQFIHDIRQIKKGISVTRNEYVFNNPSAVPKDIVFQPAPVLVVEGLFIQYFKEIDRELDLTLFIDAHDHLKLARRIIRDSEERGYGVNDVLYRFQHHVMPVYQTAIEPLRDTADLVIPNNHHFGRALEWLEYAIRGRLSAINQKSTQ